MPVQAVTRLVDLPSPGAKRPVQWARITFIEGAADSSEVAATATGLSVRARRAIATDLENRAPRSLERPERQTHRSNL